MNNLYYDNFYYPDYYNRQDNTLKFYKENLNETNRRSVRNQLVKQLALNSLKEAIVRF